MKKIVSIDDGNLLDFEVADLLLKYKIDGIFFIPNSSKYTDLSTDHIKELSRNFEIGGHTVSHPEDIKLLEPVKIFKEVLENKSCLKGITGQEINWFCYPGGRYNDLVMQIVQDAGFQKARTTLVGHCYYGNSLQVHPSVHIYPNRKEYGGMNWLEYAKKLFDENKNGDYFHIWGHSWEIEKFNLWNEFEELLEYIS
jgi:peptidoglycan-N-acetylglucosamine deacetylase